MSPTGYRAALFDMDRTLVRKDTATLYTRYRRDAGEAGWQDGLRVAWWLLQYTLGVIDVERVAARALRSFRGESEQRVVDSCYGWFRDYVRPHVTAAGRMAVARHLEAGDLVAIVTGATLYATEPLARELGVQRVVCTRLEVDAQGRLTGRVVPPLCYGAGKIARAEELARAEGFALDEAVFYSDSITDLPLLQRVGTPVVVNPDARLRREARRRRWRIERW